MRLPRRTFLKLGLIAALTVWIGRERRVLAEHLYYVNFRDVDGLPDGWNFYSSDRTKAANAFIQDGHLQLACRQVDGKWFGASGVLEKPQLYGRFVIKVRCEPGHGVKMLALLWPADGSWPPEIDFLEMGDLWWERQHNAQSIHYGPVEQGGHHPIIHSGYERDMTRWHEVEVEWRHERVVYRLDGQTMREITDPHISDQPMKLHLSCKPTRDVEPRDEVRMHVQYVRVFE